MKFKLIKTYLVKYGIQEGGKEWGKEKLKAVTPNLVGKVVKAPDGSLVLVVEMEFDDVGLLISGVPKAEIEKAVEAGRSSIVLPDHLEGVN